MILTKLIKPSLNKNIPQISLCSGIFSWGMGSGPVKGFNSQDVQQIITKKHDPTQNKIGKEDAETATFAAGLCSFNYFLEILLFLLIAIFRMFLGSPVSFSKSSWCCQLHGWLYCW